jgi:hypothetical protein
MPALTPSTSYSFYPYPIKSTPTTSLRGLAPPTQTQPQAGPSISRRAEITQAAHVRERAERRALVGLRPAGFAVGRESEDLDLEEMALEDERVSLFPSIRSGCERHETHSLATYQHVRTPLLVAHR